MMFELSGSYSVGVVMRHCRVFLLLQPTCLNLSPQFSISPDNAATGVPTSSIVRLAVCALWSEGRDLELGVATMGRRGCTAWYRRSMGVAGGTAGEVIRGLAPNADHWL